MSAKENPGAATSGALDETAGNAVSGVQNTSIDRDSPLTPADEARAGAAPPTEEGLLNARLSIRAGLEMVDPPAGKDQEDAPVKPRKSHANTAKIYAEDPVLRHLGTNTMGGRLAWKAVPPWRPAGRTSRLVDDHDLAMIDAALCWYFGGEHSSLTERACTAARTAHAGSNRFSPWRDYIESLPAWDGVDRLTSSIPTARGVGTEYVGQTLLNFWLGMMQRAYEPGCQLDSMLVLQGGQGVRKTSWFRAIPPADLSIVELDSVPSSTENKDAMAAAHQAPIALIDELDKLRKKDDQAAVKAFVTGRQDTWRAPYGRVDETHQRQFVIAGTTNKPEFLKDATGNRRYPVLVVDAPIPADVLTREHMDLLLAEARDRYLRGERLDYSAAYEALAEQARETHIDDPVREAVHDWLDDPELAPGVRLDTSLVSVAMLCQHVKELQELELKSGSMRDRLTFEAIEAAMDAHPKYDRCVGRKTVGGKKVRKAWEKKPEPETSPRGPVLDERQQRLLDISEAARVSKQFLKDPHIFQVGQLHATWAAEQRWDEDLAKVVEGTKAGQRLSIPDEMRRSVEEPARKPLPFEIAIPDTPNGASPAEVAPAPEPRTLTPAIEARLTPMGVLRTADAEEANR